MHQCHLMKVSSRYVGQAGCLARVPAASDSDAADVAKASIEQ
jgi:hypothetical protein